MSPWMPIALGELDVAEIPGPRDAPRVVQYHQATSLAASDDEVPWCASFTGWCLREAGVTPTGSAAARSYEAWGQPVLRRYGAIIVLSRGAPTSGHVGFYVDEDATRLWLLSGNTGNKVCVAPFAKDRIVACRWPL